jgi:hypothetical protein
MYRMTVDNFINHGKENYNSKNPKDPYYSWKTEKLEVIMENLPIEIFETSYR